MFVVKWISTVIIGPFNSITKEPTIKRRYKCHSLDKLFLTSGKDAGSADWFCACKFTFRIATCLNVDRGISLKRGATILNMAKSLVKPSSVDSFVSLNAQSEDRWFCAFKLSNSNLGYLVRGGSLSISHEGSSDIDWYLKTFTYCDVMLCNYN